MDLIEKLKLVCILEKSEVKVTAIEGISKKEYEAFIKFDGKFFGYNGPTFQVNTTKPSNNKYHFIFINDKSGSMSGTDAQPSEQFIKQRHNNRVGALYQCIYAFLKARAGYNDIVSCIQYDSHANIIFANLPANPDNIVKNYLLNYTADGGTEYRDPIMKSRNILTNNPSGHIPVAYFMSDGECGDNGATTELQSIMSQYSSLGFKLHTIGFGPSALNFAILESLAKIGNGTFSNSSINLNDLTNKYVALAGLLE